ncbi:helix-turn-helix domain-containing protein [Flavobacterium croceum]|uniref:helix-turn-helix domain-containing protein n=1 Tax=Flavobacterium croceum TaxID=370975 RepID=UPI0024A87745|nr:helix-turn-helix domain-containing protein [Flavobacterium croceum]
METIGQKILRFRKQKRMSQEELADLSTISLRTIQRIEKDKNEPRGNTLKLICEALDVPLENFIEHKNINNKQLLMFLHLSVLIGFIIPLANIFIPFILWFNNKDKDLEIDLQGKNIINFQILFSLLTYFVFIVGVYGKITHNYSASIFLYTYFVLQFIVLIYPVFISIKIAKNDILYYYPNFFKIVK